MQRCLQGFKAGASSVARTKFLLEHPEDLGAVEEQWPASVWQLDDTLELASLFEACCGALFQCHHGAETPKPTRFLGTLAEMKKHLHIGWPSFSSSRIYQGPLPAHCGHLHPRRKMGVREDGTFATVSYTHLTLPTNREV